MQAYILADTTYNPLSVDEVAAAHVNADCVVRHSRGGCGRVSGIVAQSVCLLPGTQSPTLADECAMLHASLAHTFASLCAARCTTGAPR